jgi:hypothetical protein
LSIILVIVESIMVSDCATPDPSGSSARLSPASIFRFGRSVVECDCRAREIEVFDSEKQPSFEVVFRDVGLVVKDQDNDDIGNIDAVIDKNFFDVTITSSFF